MKGSKGFGYVSVLRRKLRRVWLRAAGRRRKLVFRNDVRARSGEDGARPENVVWIFGSGRTGSTWLSSMMGEMSAQTVWREPLVGAMLGYFYYVRNPHRADRPGEHFILGEAHKETWTGPVRDLVLGGAEARFPGLSGKGYVVIKEPNGSIGAPLLMEALPESRMILLVRDPRDVVASSLDARKEGSWLRERRSADGGKRKPLSNNNPNVYVRARANDYLRHAGNSKQAYESHKGYKALVRYEDLRADTLGTMKRIYSDLGIPVDEEELARAVEKHAWENVPEQDKGQGKFYRKATPGGWREDLTPRQVEIVEEITGPLLEDLYPA